VTSIPDASLVAAGLNLAAKDETKAPGPHAHTRESVLSPVTLKALYDAHARAIHRFLCDLLGDPSAARDATQETFVRAFQRLHTLEAKDRPAPWLFGIARNVSLEFRRARRRLRRVLDDEPLEAWEDNRVTCSGAGSPEDDAISREALRHVQGALAALSHDRRTVLLLRIDHDMSSEDIARAMGWSVPKVKVEIHRARIALREELQRTEGGGR
jgi:RNA polymerase sigma-70 factor, ECF subfamily